MPRAQPRQPIKRKNTMDTKQQDNQARSTLATGSAPWCIKCGGDGWLSGEWDECPACYGTGSNLSDETRRIYRVRKAERESASSAKRLDAAEAEHAKNMAELASAQGALFGANLSSPNSVIRTHSVRPQLEMPGGF